MRTKAADKVRMNGERGMLTDATQQGFVSVKTKDTLAEYT